jgi:hypothetical protein
MMALKSTLILYVYLTDTKEQGVLLKLTDRFIVPVRAQVWFEVKT